MANYFVNLPAAQIPRNAMLDFEPINNALESIQQTNMANQQRADRLDERAYQRGRDARQDARVATQDARSSVEWFGKQAAAVDRLQGPQRAAAWQRILSQHPDHSSLTPDYLDPMKGPAMVAAEAGQWRDPRDDQIKDLDLQKTRAEIDRLSRYPNGETPSNVREYEYFKSLTPEAQQQYLTMKRAQKMYDTGVEFVQPNAVNPAGPPVTTIQKQPAEVERQKTIGEQEGKAVMDLPRQVDNATLALKTIDQIRNHPGKAYGVGVTGVLPGIPGTSQRGFVNLVEQAKGKTFLEAFNSLRGGGQITEAEGSKATQALARLDRAQTQEDFDAALSDLAEVINLGLSRAQKAASGETGKGPRKMDLGDGFSVEFE